jgi:hypothetical protein
MGDAASAAPSLDMIFMSDNPPVAILTYLMHAPMHRSENPPVAFLACLMHARMHGSSFEPIG